MRIFITFEGPEGSGKSTQVRLLVSWLRTRGVNVLATREPGGTEIGDRIRSLLLSPTTRALTVEAEVLLFSASRAQLVQEVIRPHLEQGGVVVCDRYADSTLAYQGYGRGVDLEVLQTITRFATRGLVPDITFLLDIPVAEGLARKRGNQAEWNRMEQEVVAYHERVRAGYLALAAADPHRWHVLDAREDVATLHARIRHIVAEKLGWSGDEVDPGHSP